MLFGQMDCFPLGDHRAFPDLIWSDSLIGSDSLNDLKLSRKTNFVHCFRLWQVVLGCLPVGFVLFCDVRLVNYSSPGVSHLNKTEENDFEYLVKHLHFFLILQNDLSVDSPLNDRSLTVGTNCCF